MNISKQEVQHIAGLVRLRLSDAEIEKYRKQLEQILDYVGQLKTVSAADVPSFSPSRLENVFRSDEPAHTDGEETKRLVQMAPEKEKGLIRTKGIFNKCKM